MVSKKSTKKSSKKASPKSAPKSSKKSMKKMCGTACSSSNGGCIWFLGFVGAAVYYISTTTGFWAGLLGVLKALVWPAMLVFKLLGM